MQPQPPPGGQVIDALVCTSLGRGCAPRAVPPLAPAAAKQSRV